MARVGRGTRRLANVLHKKTRRRGQRGAIGPADAMWGKVVSIQQGTNIDTLTLQVGGSAANQVAGVEHLNSYDPVVGDQVRYDNMHGVPLVLGTPGSYPVAEAEEEATPAGPGALFFFGADSDTGSVAGLDVNGNVIWTVTLPKEGGSTPTFPWPPSQAPTLDGLVLVVARYVEGCAGDQDYLYLLNPLSGATEQVSGSLGQELSAMPVWCDGGSVVCYIKDTNSLVAWTANTGDSVSTALPLGPYPQIEPPYPSLTAVTGTGSLAEGQYSYELTAYVTTDTNETVASNANTIDLSETGEIEVSWSLPSGADGVNVYRYDEDTDTYCFMISVASGTTEWTDDGSVTPDTSRNPPAVAVSGYFLWPIYSYDSPEGGTYTQIAASMYLGSGDSFQPTVYAYDVTNSLAAIANVDVGSTVTAAGYAAGCFILGTDGENLAAFSSGVYPVTLANSSMTVGDTISSSLVPSYAFALYDLSGWSADSATYGPIVFAVGSLGPFDFAGVQALGFNSGDVVSWAPMGSAGATTYDNSYSVSFSAGGDSTTTSVFNFSTGVAFVLESSYVCGLANHYSIS